MAFVWGYAPVDLRICSCPPATMLAEASLRDLEALRTELDGTKAIY